MQKVKIYEYDSPCGKLYLAARKGSLCLCSWAGSKNLTDTLSRLSKALDIEFILPDSVNADSGEVAETGPRKARPEKPSKVIVSAMKQLGQFFSGRRKTFNIPYQMAGTPFQNAVWKSLLDIPYGKSVSYAEIASMAGYPKAVRAAANACGDNAISIIIPCHRVIGSDDGLTGYGGGLGAKRYLLDLESPQQRLPFKTVTKKPAAKKPIRKTAKKTPAKKSTKKAISRKKVKKGDGAS
ncbi:MAG: methylated-DNA--[Bacteroidales bacterium]|nr:methylated-DNA--[protein]-cysteine S-methyltransferase [Bacteroidales bacterium]